MNWDAFFFHGAIDKMIWEKTVKSFFLSHDYNLSFNFYEVDFTANIFYCFTSVNALHS